MEQTRVRILTLITGCVIRNNWSNLILASPSSLVNRIHLSPSLGLLQRLKKSCVQKYFVARRHSINVWGWGKHPLSRSLGKNDKDSFGHFDVCISIMDLLRGSVLRPSINSYSTSVRQRANADNSVSILLTKLVSQAPVNKAQSSTPLDRWIAFFL